jgi:hypothetical protein
LSHGETIQRLRALLDRVRTRSTEPRDSFVEAKTEPQGVEPGLAPIESVAPAADRASREDHASRERLVAAEPAAMAPSASAPPADAAEPAEPTEMAGAEESMPSVDVTEIEVTAEIEVAEDEGEPAPASSRRPVAPEPEERLAEIAFGSEEPPQPLHTPPPESGRLPAVPGIPFESDSDFAGLRTPTPLLPRRLEALSHMLEPEAVRPEIPPSDTVGEVIAQAQRFAPPTFVALLDASLAL